jgi:PAS domain S-box-containing protein
MINELLNYRKYSEYRYKILYDGIPDFLRTVNRDGIIIDCNMSYANAFGYSKNELVGTSIFENIAKESMDAMRKSFETWKNNFSYN